MYTTDPEPRRLVVDYKSADKCPDLRFIFDKGAGGKNVHGPTGFVDLFNPGSALRSRGQSSNRFDLCGNERLRTGIRAGCVNRLIHYKSRTRGVRLECLK